MNIINPITKEDDPRFIATLESINNIDIPEGGFNNICMDVPWNHITYSKKGLMGRPQHYPRISKKCLKLLPVKELAAKDCHLFFWTSGPYLEQAFEIIKALGFRYSSIAFTWVKLNPKEADSLFMMEDSFHMGQGYTTRKNTEICLLAKRGKPKRIAKNIRELIITARREHSRKPDEFYHRVKRYSAGTFLDMFAREKREGFVTWGSEVNKFVDEKPKEGV